MTEVFRNQAQAREYIAKISDHRERLFTEAALSRALGVWARDPEQRSRLATEPIDILAFVKAIHAFSQSSEVIQGILTGRYKSMDEFPAF